MEDKLKFIVDDLPSPPSTTSRISKEIKTTKIGTETMIAVRHFGFVWLSISRMISKAPTSISTANMNHFMSPVNRPVHEMIPAP
jgi:hypothetical protein